MIIKGGETMKKPVKSPIPCKICGTDTHMLGTKMCSPCWELINYFTYFLMRTPQHLVKLLKEVTK